VASRTLTPEEIRDLAVGFALNAGTARARVCRIGAKNFRAFRSVELEPGNLTAIVGPNAAGKSSVIDLFRFLADSLSLSLYTALERRGGIKAVRHTSPTHPRNCQIWIELAYDDDYRSFYTFRMRSEAGGSYSVPEEECLVSHDGYVLGRLALKDGRITELRSQFGLFDAQRSDPPIDRAALALPVLGVTPEFAPVLTALRDLRSYSIVPDKLRELQDPDEGAELASDGSNAASVLRHLEDADRRELIAMLAYVVPGVLDVNDVSHGNKLTLRFTQQASSGKNSFEALQMSDGTLRLLGLLLALYQRHTPTFLAIEEPEATIHVAAQQALIEVFRSRSTQTQILLTTHSSDILDSLDVDSIYLVVAEDGHSRLASVAEEPKRAVHEALFSPGELLRSGALEPTP
jgi:predicted ATPase